MICFCLAILTNNFMVQSKHCKTYEISSGNYNITNSDLVIASYIFMENQLETNGVNQQFDYWFQHIASLSSIIGFNVKFIVYRYSYKCKIKPQDLFLDILLNNGLNNGKVFKILGTLAYLNNVDLIYLTNIMSPYAIPVIATFPLPESHVQHIRSMYDSYHNVVYSSYSNYRKLEFLAEFMKKFNIKLVSILHDSVKPERVKEIDVIKTNLRSKLVCISSHFLSSRYLLSQGNIVKFLQRELANVFLIMLEQQTVFPKLIQGFSKLNKRAILIFYNHYKTNLITPKVHEVLSSVNDKVSNLGIVEMFEVSSDFQNFQEFYKWSDNLLQGTGILSGILTSYIENDTENRNIKGKFYKQLLSRYPADGSPNKFNLHVYYVKKRGHRFSSEILYTHKKNFPGRPYWWCRNCEEFAGVDAACESNICSSGNYPSYPSDQCCWKCLTCPSTYVKPNEGQHLCTKCRLDSIPNKNRTQCLPFIYKYLTLNSEQELGVKILSTLGSAYTLFFLVVFVYYKSTPIVKSSNMKLSLVQLTLHLFLNIHMATSILQQVNYTYLTHWVLGSYLLKTIKLIYIIKTNQLLTIFQSKVKMKRNACITLKEIYFPITYLSANVFTTLAVLLHHKLEYGILQPDDSLVRYQYCKMATYFYTEMTAMLILSILCFFQAFLARKLPAHFNETCYIYLGMFPISVLLMVSIILCESFIKDGLNILAASCLFYVINIALLSVTYGNKIFIILFQKHQNTSSAFQEMMMKDIQKDVTEKLAKRAGKKKCLSRNKHMKETLRNIYQNTGFLSPAFCRINPLLPNVPF